MPTIVKPVKKQYKMQNAKPAVLVDLVDRARKRCARAFFLDHRNARCAAKRKNSKVGTLQQLKFSIFICK